MNQAAQEMLVEELFKAHEDFPRYARRVLGFSGVSQDPQDYKRALLQALLRVQMLRIEASKLIAEFAEQPPGTSVLKTEEYFLKFLALQIGSMAGANEERVLKELASRFEIDLNLPAVLPEGKEIKPPTPITQ